jgi:hypothetical protein
MKKILLLIALSFSGQLWAGDNFKMLEKIELNKYQKQTLMEIKESNKGKAQSKLKKLVEALDLSEDQVRKLNKFKKTNKEKIKTKMKSLNLTDEQKSKLKGLKRLIKKDK